MDEPRRKSLSLWLYRPAKKQPAALLKSQRLPVMKPLWPGCASVLWVWRSPPTVPQEPQLLSSTSELKFW